MLKKGAMPIRPAGEITGFNRFVCSVKGGSQTDRPIRPPPFVGAMLKMAKFAGAGEDEVHCEESAGY